MQVLRSVDHETSVTTYRNERIGVDLTEVDSYSDGLFSESEAVVQCTYQH
jgi:hypothetical protein